MNISIALVNQEYQVPTTSLAEALIILQDALDNGTADSFAL